MTKHLARRRTLPSRLGRLYDDALVIARAYAREHGYALAVHGSELRDLDLLAVPWVEEASSPATLMEAIREHLGGTVVMAKGRRDGATLKPHGRLAWAIRLPCDDDPAMIQANPYIDLSVMPPRRRLAS